MLMRSRRAFTHLQSTDGICAGALHRGRQGAQALSNVPQAGGTSTEQCPAGSGFKHQQAWQRTGRGKRIAINNMEDPGC